MADNIQNLVNQTVEKIRTAESQTQLDSIYVELFGKKGKFTQLTKGLGKASLAERRHLGKILNQAKKKIGLLFSQQKKYLSKKRLDRSIDVTDPAKPPSLGSLHIVSQAITEISSIFERIGFTRERYPEIEWEWYAFDSLNMPANCPARDDFETFFIDAKPHSKLGKMVLSPHTSSGQVREMLRKKNPPIRMMNIAKCYRPNWDISHTPMFHQFEGLVIDKNINITHLKGTLNYFVQQFFGKGRKIRLRPFHFQFTEPSFEVDVTCIVCKSKGCRLCKEGWLEMAGAGMVHPKVLKAGRIDPKIYTGFAFGWGVERAYMMKEGLAINDLRLLYSNDIRFLEQF